MANERIGLTAVTFVSHRTAVDEPGYLAASAQMEALAATQPGYRGSESARGSDGCGITISYWADDAAARAWRDQPDHAAIREMGRTRWYDDYTLTVATVTRAYRWARD